MDRVRLVGPMAPATYLGTPAVWGNKQEGGGGGGEGEGGGGGGGGAPVHRKQLTVSHKHYNTVCIILYY